MRLFSKKHWVICGLMILLSGCGTMSSIYHKQNYVTDRDYDYLKAQQVSPLQVPLGVDGSELGNDYQLPNYNYPVPVKAVSQVPPGSI